MKLAVNARFLHHPYSGIGQYLLGVLEAFHRSEKQDRLLLYTHKPYTLPWEDARIEVRVLPEWKWLPSAGARKSMWEWWQWPRAVLQDGVDAAFVPYPSLSQMAGIPMVTCVHDVIPWADAHYTPGMASSLYHRMTARRVKASTLITVSEFSAEEVERVLGVRPSVVHPGSAFDYLEVPEEGRVREVQEHYQLDRPYVLYVGGYDQRKNVPAMLESYHRHVAMKEEVDLVLVGSPLFATGLYTDPMGLALGDTLGRVHSVGFVSNEELYALYKGALGLVHFTSYEGFNLPVLQACKAGVPSMLYPIPPHEELFTGAFLSITSGQEGEVWQCFLHDDGVRKELIREGGARATVYHFDHTLGKLWLCIAQLRGKK